MSAEICLQVMELAPRFQHCVNNARAEENGQAGASTSEGAVDDEEFAKGAARLFVELGESYTAMIASGDLQCLGPLLVQFKCSNSLLELCRDKAPCNGHVLHTAGKIFHDPPHHRLDNSHGSIFHIGNNWKDCS